MFGATMGSLLVIAGTSSAFSDFGPYAPAVNDQGTVAFQATRRTGGTGTFCGDGGPITCIHARGTHRSHPALARDGTLCVYADMPDGSQVLLRGRAGAAPEAISHAAFPRIGPLGPTINAHGAVAFRATSASGRAGIYVAGAKTTTRVAEVGELFHGFEGLPVILDDGSVIFRADQIDGRAAILRWSRDGSCQTVVTTGGEFVELGRFPHGNAAGSVVFTALRRDGSSGVFVARGAIEARIVSGRSFESFRSALIDSAGRIVFSAVPAGGELALHALDPAGPRRIIGLRDEFGTCPLTDFALNPVSFNDRGQVALRLRLADGRQFIARLDVFAPA